MRRIDIRTLAPHDKNNPSYNETSKLKDTRRPLRRCKRDDGWTCLFTSRIPRASSAYVQLHDFGAVPPTGRVAAWQDRKRPTRAPEFVYRRCSAPQLPPD